MAAPKRTVKDLTREELEQFASLAQEVMWADDYDENNNVITWDREKEVSGADTVEWLGGALESLGLAPTNDEKECPNCGEVLDEDLACRNTDCVDNPDWTNPGA